MGQLIANGVIAGLGYALMALSFGLIYRAARFLHFAHGAVFTWGAYLTLLAQTAMGLPLIASLIAATLASAGLGALVLLTVYRPLSRRGSTSTMLLLASMGVYVVLQNVLALAFTSTVQTLPFKGDSGALHLGGVVLTRPQVMLVAVVLTSSLLLWWLLGHSLLGRQLRAVASDPELATIHGLPTASLTLAAFALGSALAGVAGALAALDVGMTPTMGMPALMCGVVAMLVGGPGRVLGALIGGFALGLLQHATAWFIGGEWMDAVAFAVLLVTLLTRPAGLAVGSARTVLEGQVRQ